VKALIAAACVAVIAAVGYYFWGEWQGRQARLQQQEFAERRGKCLNALDSITMDENEVVVANCLAFGGLEEADLEATRRKLGIQPAD